MIPFRPKNCTGRMLQQKAHSYTGKWVEVSSLLLHDCNAKNPQSTPPPPPRSIDLTPEVISALP